LPAPVAAEVRIWTEALHGRGPRAGRPRHPRTIEAYLRVLETPLGAWAGQYGSLRQVTTEDVTAQLALFTGATRLLALSAMRSLFTTLKARRVPVSHPPPPPAGRARPPTGCARPPWAAERSGGGVGACWGRGRTRGPPPGSAPCPGTPPPPPPPPC